MRKVLLIILFFLICSISYAQNKFFFESIKVNSFLYTDDIYYGKEEWLKQFKAPYRPSSSRFDSLGYYQRFREWFVINIRGGVGVRAQLQKTIPVFSSASLNKFEWSTGAGFRTFKMHGDPYSYNTFPADTTGNYFFEQEQFQLRQSFIDIHNSVVFTHHSKLLKGLYASVGFGLQSSFSVSSKIEDSYSSHQQKWNVALHKWEDVNINKSTTLVPAKNCNMFIWTIPFGLGAEISKRMSFEWGIEYYHAKRSPVITEKKYTEGSMFQMIIGYKL